MTKKPPCCNSSTGTTPTAANCGRRPPSAPRTAELGITDLWLPPAYKGASGGYSVGYDTYDLFDLGEFDQKGSVATKYGDKAALEHAATTLREHGVGYSTTWCSTTSSARTRKNRYTCSRWTPTTATTSTTVASTRWPTPASPFPAAGRAFRVYLGLHMLQRRRLR